MSPSGCAYRPKRMTEDDNEHTTDIYRAQKRSEIMSNVRAKNTTPERLVRSTLFGLGYRFRLHSKDLPGKPDIVLRKHKTVIFVNGCFWHHHTNCKKATYPKNNADFWKQKLDANVERDRRNWDELQHLGWRVLVVWECETKNRTALAEQLRQFLG